MMEVSTTTASTPEIPSPVGFNQGTLQQQLQALIEGTHENWTYAIFWQPTKELSGVSMLGWGNGYYKGEEEDKEKLNQRSSSSSFSVSTEQEYRKKVLRDLNSLISGGSATSDDASVDEVTDSEWFFLVSMSQSFAYDSGLAGKAFSTAKPVWLCGSDQLSGSGCERAKQGGVYGIQTIVCIPLSHGVVELGSIEKIQQNSDLIKKVQIIFGFDDGTGDLSDLDSNLCQNLSGLSL